MYSTIPLTPLLLLLVVMAEVMMIVMHGK